jgi:hypothetical protein
MMSEEIKEKLEDIGRKIEDMYKKRELDLIKKQVLKRVEGGGHENNSPASQ